MLAVIVDPIFYVMWTMWNPNQPEERPHRNEIIAVENFDLPIDFSLLTKLQRQE